MKVLVTGAAGGTGQAVARELDARGHEVVALVRDRARAAPLLLRAALVEGDARDAVAVAKALQGCGAVISALGTRKVGFVRPVTMMSEATRTLARAMERQGVAQLVCITGVGAGDSEGHGGFLYDRLFKPVFLRMIYQDKNRQEAVVRDSNLEWVIVRPTRLTDKAASGRIKAITDLRGFHGGQISRQDVASFVVAQLTDATWLRRTPLITQA